MNKGFIKLHRSLLDWEWYDDPNSVRLLIHLLLSANYEPKKWHGLTIEPGQFVFSWEKLSKNLRLTVQQLRTAMNKLEQSEEIHRKSTNKYQVVTLLKWSKLQVHQQADNNQITIKQQSNNNQITTTKEGKERKKEKNSTSVLFNAPDEFEFLSYAKQIYSDLKKDFEPYEFAIKNKFETWAAASWKDGNKKQIKNWKLKLKNTIPYLKPVYKDKSNEVTINVDVVREKIRNEINKQK